MRKVDPAAEMMFGRIGRGADQSLWGAEIPYHINPRCEAKKNENTRMLRVPACTGGIRSTIPLTRSILTGFLRDGRSRGRSAV